MGEPHSLQLICHVIINILFFIGEGSILIRLWTRGVILKQFEWDDWAMFFCLVRTESLPFGCWQFVHLTGRSSSTLVNKLYYICSLNMVVVGKAFCRNLAFPFMLKSLNRHMQEVIEDNPNDVTMLLKVSIFSQSESSFAKMAPRCFLRKKYTISSCISGSNSASYSSISAWPAQESFDSSSSVQLA